MSYTKQFIKQLQEGNTTEAIALYKMALKEAAIAKINESRNEILESYGFTLSEEEKQKEDDNEDDDLDENEDGEDDEEENKKRDDD